MDTEVYVVLYSHIDVGWGYYWGPSLEYIERQNNVIAFSALNLIKNDLDFKWTIDNVYVIKRLLRDFPALRDFIISALKEGRIEVSPPAVAISPLYIDGESLIRNVLLGREFYKNLGVKKHSPVFIAFDVTCHHPQLPQILRKLGFEYYVPGRPDMKAYKLKGVPIEFIWEGLDGSRILCNRVGYGWAYVELKEPLGIKTWSEGAEEIVQHLEKKVADIYEGVESPYIIYIGRDWHEFHPAICELIRYWRSKGRKVVVATPSEYFKHLPKKKLKVVKGDLDPVSWAAIYGVGGDIVRYNIIKAVGALLNCEKTCTIASLYGRKYPYRKIKKAWYYIAISWHHDMSHGYVSQTDCEKWIKILKNIRFWALSETKRAINYIALKINTVWAKGTPLVVFNTLPWRRTDKASLKITLPENLVPRIYDYEGNSVPCQVKVLKKLGDKKLVKVEFIAEVPGLGYRVYDLRLEKGEYSEEISGEKSVENKYFKVEFSKGCISSLYDKQTGIQVLETSKYLGNDLVLQKVKFRPPDGLAIDEVLSETKSSDYIAEKEVLIKGELYTTYVSDKSFEKIKVKQKILVHNYKPVVEFFTTIEDHHYDHRIRAVFPLNFKGKVYRSIPFGVVEFEPEKEPYVGWERSNGKLPGVFWASTWADYSSENYGVTLANRARIGYQIEENVLSTVLLATRDPSVLTRFAYPHLIGTGKYTFNYILVPHTEDWKHAKPYLTVEEWLNPLIVVEATRHDGLLPPEKSIIEVSGNAVLLSALYKDLQGIVMRLYEVDGEEKEYSVKLDGKGVELLETDMLGKIISKVPRVLKPYEIKTLLIRRT
ncbi:MAG: hypothetical protein DRN04_04510 [Thermoprotei archaeon]|nr:MAG: hypothetical protein DRN04_04510 [Thermoprotei archaeon]